MSSRTQLNRLFASSLEISVHKIDRIGVKLQEAGLIKSGGRGPYAPTMDNRDFVTIFLAIMGCDNTNRAAEVVTEYSNLKSNDGDRLADILLQTLWNPGIAEHIKKIKVCRSYPEASIYVGNRKIKFESEKGNVDSKKRVNLKPALRVDATVTGDIIYHCANKLISWENDGDYKFSQ